MAPGGRDQGAVVGLGSPNIGWGGSDYSRPVNDRFNLSISRQLPHRIVVEVTGFANFSHNLNYAYNLNQVDPKIIYQNKAPRQLPWRIRSAQYRPAVPGQL